MSSWPCSHPSLPCFRRLLPRRAPPASVSPQPLPTEGFLWAEEGPRPGADESRKDRVGEASRAFSAAGPRTSGARAVRTASQGLRQVALARRPRPSRV